MDLDHYVFCVRFRPSKQYPLPVQAIATTALTDELGVNFEDFCRLEVFSRQLYVDKLFGED